MHPRLRYRPGRFDNMSRASKDRAKLFLANTGELRPHECAICGAHDFDPIGEVDRYGFHYPTGICRACGNVQQYEYYSAEDIGTLYSQYYRDIYWGLGPSELFTGQQAIGRSIVDFVRANIGSPIRNVLEIGTGAGGILHAFKEAGYEVKGLDFDERYIEKGRSEGVSINHGGLDTLQDDEKFDLIIMNHVLEHIVDVRGLMAEIARHLTPGGHFYVEVPSLESVGTSYRGDLLIYFQNAHFLHFTRGSLANLLAISGYEMVAEQGAISALLRYTGKTSPIANHYAESRAKVDALERTYASLRHKLPYLARRYARKGLEAIGMRSFVRAWRRWRTPAGHV